MHKHHSAQQIFDFCKENWPETHTLSHQYVLYLHRLLQLETANSDPVLKKYGLSGAEFDVLATLRRAEPPHVLSPTQLQQSTLLSSGGQTKLLHQLEAKGFVDRSLNEEDKRSKFVHLTASGKVAIEQAMDGLLWRLDDVFKQAGLKKKEIKDLIELLHKLLSVFESDE